MITVYRRVGMLALTLLMVALWAHGPVWAQDSGAGQSGQGQVGASAVLTDANGQQVGVVRFMDGSDTGTVRVMVQVQNMAPGYQELVLASMGQCDAAGTPPYSSAGDSLNLNDQQFPFRAGDLLPVYVMQNGTGEMSFLTDRFTTADLLDADGSAVLVRLGAVLMGIPGASEQGGQGAGAQAAEGQTGEMTATPQTGEAGSGQMAEMTPTTEAGAAGSDQGQTAEMTPTTEAGAAGSDQGQTAEMTATPEAGAAGSDQGQTAEMTPTTEAGAAEGQTAEMTATPEVGAAEGQTAEMTATPETGQAEGGQAGQQGQAAIGVVGEYFACGVVMQGDAQGATTAGGEQGAGQTAGAADMTTTPEGQQGAEMTATPEAGQSQGETSGAAQGEPITVSLVDGKIEMPASIPGGSVTFQVTNNGSMEHGLVIEGVDDASFEKSLDHNLQPGESATLQVDLQPGAYRAYCPVDGHAEQGMQLDLTVTDAGS